MPGPAAGVNPDAAGLEELLEAGDAVLASVATGLEAAHRRLRAGVEVVVDVDRAGLDALGQADAARQVGRPDPGGQPVKRNETVSKW